MSGLENAPLLPAAVKSQYLLDLCWSGLETRELLTASLQNVWLSPATTPSHGVCQPNSSFSRPLQNPHSWQRMGNGFQARQIIWWGCGNCKTLHLPEKWHRLSTRHFQRGKLIYGRNAHKSCYFLMGFGSLFLTPCFEMYPTAYSINEFKHSDFLISGNHSSLGFDFFWWDFLMQVWKINIALEYQLGC